MKLVIHNFFYDQDLSPFFYLFKLVFNENIELGTLDDSDILLESIFGKDSYLNKKKWRYTFCFIGEADRRTPIDVQNRYHAYSCVLKAELSNHNIINFPLFVFYNYSNHFVYDFKKNENCLTIPKKDVCVIITNGVDSEGRNYFLDKLEKRVSVSYAGKYKNNVKRIDAPPCTKEFVDFVSEYKIIFSMENSKNKEYITEKILHGYASKNVPIYWGSDSVGNYFNEERFIHVKGFDETSINNSIDAIEEILNNDNKYIEMINKPIYKDNYVPLTLTMIANDIQRLINIKNTQVKKFITFGNQPYYNSVVRICEESKKIRIFNEIYGYTDKYLKKDTEFWNKHGKFIEENRRGYGYWLWKPYLIKKELDKSKENDIVFYCDAGCQVNEKGKRRLHEYIDMLNTSESGIISFQLTHLERLYTKNKVFETLESDKRDALQCLATVILVKKNKNSTNIINQWYENCENYKLLNDEIEKEKEDELFIENRHDQSILSLLVNKMDTIKIKDETYFSDWTHGEEFPFLKKRLR